MPRQEWVGIEPMGEVFLLTFLFIGLSDSSGTFMRAWRPKPSPAVLLLVGSRRLRGLPVLVHEASRRVWVYDYAGPGRNSRYRSRPYCLPPMQKRQRPNCLFSELNTQPTCTPVYPSPNTSRCATPNSPPRGSLLLSRRTLSFPPSSRFIPPPRLCDLSPLHNP